MINKSFSYQVNVWLTGNEVGVLHIVECGLQVTPTRPGMELMDDASDSPRKRPGRYSASQIIWWIFLGLMIIGMTLAVLFGSVTAIVFEALGYAKHITTTYGSAFAYSSSSSGSAPYIPGSLPVDYYGNQQSFESGDWPGRVFLKFGSTRQVAHFRSPSNFETSARAYNIYVGTNAVIGYLAGQTMWIQNATLPLSAPYYLVNSIVESLYTLVTDAIQAVNPTQLAEFLASQFKKRTTYTSEFVQYLANTEAAIVTLQNQTTGIMNATLCRGKPFEISNVVLLGDQSLVAGVNQYVTWGAITQLPPSPTGRVDFVVHGNALVTGAAGVYSAVFTSNLVIPANTVGTTTVTLNQNAVAVYQVPCTQDQATSAGPTTFACQSSALLTLQGGDAISITMTAAFNQTTLTAANSKLVLARVC